MYTSKINSLTDLGKGSIKFESFNQLKHQADGEKLRSLLMSMSCLMTIIEMSNEMHLSEMIDIVNGLQIAKKYLIIYIEMLNVTMLANRTINFNVMINHRGKGVLNKNQDTTGNL